MKQSTSSLLVTALCAATLQSSCGSDCAERSLDACTNSSSCALIRAEPLRNDECAEPEQPVACREADTGCGAAITYARDADGQNWQFRDTCTPAGWTLETPAHGFLERCAFVP